MVLLVGRICGVPRDLRLSWLNDFATDSGRRGVGNIVGVETFFAYGDGILTESGLKLCPTSRELVFVLPFQRGRFEGIGDGDWRTGTPRTADAGVRDVEEGVVDLTEDGVGVP